MDQHIKIVCQVIIFQDNVRIQEYLRLEKEINQTARKTEKQERILSRKMNSSRNISR